MKIVGHCGARGLAPGNTMKSFEAALENQVDMIETDLHCTKDNAIVLLHHLDDPAHPGKKLTIGELSLQQVLEIQPDTVTLDTLISFVNHGAGLMLEIKDPQAVDRTVAILEGYFEQGWSPDEFIISSFDYPTLLDVQKKLPQVPTMVVESWSSIRAVARARKLKTTNICMSQTYMWWGFVRRMTKRYQLYSYTPQYGPGSNNHERAKRWEKYGLAGIITDYPDRFSKESAA